MDFITSPTSNCQFTGVTFIGKSKKDINSGISKLSDEKNMTLAVCDEDADKYITNDSKMSHEFLSADGKKKLKVTLYDINW